MESATTHEQVKAEQAEEREWLQRIREDASLAPAPTCAYCGKTMRICQHAGLKSFRERGLVWGHHGNNVFCTVGCGFQFGLAAHAAGYQIKGRITEPHHA